MTNEWLEDRGGPAMAVVLRPQVQMSALASRDRPDFSSEPIVSLSLNELKNFFSLTLFTSLLELAKGRICISTGEISS